MVVCDRHSNTTGQGHINPTGKGHAAGGTEGAVPAPIDSQAFQVVHKDYVLDYTSPLKSVIMEHEGGSGGLTYRYVYGLEKLSAVITGVPNGVGAVVPDAVISGLFPARYACGKETPIMGLLT